MIEHELTIGDYTLRPSYANEPDKIEIARSSGEAGDFSRADFEAAIAAFYTEHF